MTELLLAVRLAWRNVRRYARRSLITASTIIFGFALMVFSIGFSEGSYRNAVDTAARSGTGHVEIRPKGFDPLHPTALANPQEILRAIAKIPGAVAAPRIGALVYASTSVGGANLLAIGVDPEIERSTSVFPDSMIEGEWLPSGDPLVAPALLGIRTARKLDAHLGDRLVLMAQGDGGTESILTRIGGIFATGSEETDAGMLLVSQKTLQSLLGQPDTIHRVAVILDDLQRSKAVARELAQALPNTEVLTWDKAMPALGDFIALDRAGASWMFGLLFAIVGLAVLNAVLMSVLERIKEFGLMLALGTRPRILFTSVVCEGLLLSISSVIIGAALGSLIVLYFNDKGLNISAMLDGQEWDMGGYNISGMIHPYLPVDRTARAMLMVVGLTVAGSLYPAWKAARLTPVEAILDA